MAEKKVIQIALDGDIEKLSAKIKTIQSELSKLSLGQNLNKEFEETFYSLTNELKKIQNLTDGNKINFIDVKKVEKSADVIDELYDKILRLSKSSGVESSFLKNDKKAIDALAKARASYNSKTSEGLKEQQRLEKKLAEAKEKTNSKLIRAQAIDKTREETAKRLEEAQKELASLEKQLREKGGNNSNKYLKTDSEGKVISADKRTSLGKRYNTLKEQLPDLQKEAEKAEKAIRPTLAQINEEAIKMANNITKAQKALDDFNKTQPQNQAKAFEEVRQELEKIDGIDWKSLGIDLNSINSIDELNEKLTTLSTDAGVRAHQVLENIIKASSEGAEPLRALGRSAQSAGQDVKELTDRQRDIQRLTDQLKNFFSISNSVQLFKRAVRSAFETVKELDSAMTEIAVVSDFSVGDMWEKLPEFTAQANELGVAIKDTYNATALYIQQGLDLQHSMELSNETLKMARIAGMEAADATDAMTSALRGFNMELNQISAQRVNDVYSELAAITASDVQELSTAMSKTASIAHNVNMEFETTAAFLAQGIETTRESAETIGTALKTVIGRFSEVKSLYAKGELTGTDEEGEEINVNKVQKALRSAGVDMTKFFTGEEGLDQVFLDLSKKWDTLDITTQRYIATMAAGSRQQSRFIAMISNYSKTMELVNAANNSAGASQEQYEKTLESLTSKLAKLKNAWDEFAMGLANNEVIKVAVDTLTSLLQTINKILDTVSGGSGVLKSTLSILAAIGGLKLGKSLLSTGIGKMVGDREGGWVQQVLGKKKEQQNTGYTAGIQTGKGFINGFESITKTFKLKGGKGFVQSLFSSQITPSDLSKVLNLDEWNLDFSGVDTKKAADFIASDLNKQLSSHPELTNAFSGIQANTAASSNIELYRQELSKLNLQMEMTGQQAQDMGVSVSRTAPNFQAMAIATGAAATALMALGSYLETTGEGGEKIGKVIQGLGTMLMGTIPIISMVQAAMIAGAESVSVAIKNIPIIGWIAAIISAVIGLIQMISALAPETQEEKLKRLSEQTRQAAEAAKEAQQAYKDLQESFDKYSDATDKIKKLTVGTTEWKEALFEVNSQVMELLEKFPNLEIVSEDGVLSVTEESMKAVLDEKMKQLEAAQAVQYGAQITEDEGKRTNEIKKASLYYSENGAGLRQPTKAEIENNENPLITGFYTFDELKRMSKEELSALLYDRGAKADTGDVIAEAILNDTIGTMDKLKKELLDQTGIDYPLYKVSDEFYELAQQVGGSTASFLALNDASKKVTGYLSSMANIDTKKQASYVNSIITGSDILSQSNFSNDVVNGIFKATTFDEKVNNQLDILNDPNKLSSLFADLKNEGAVFETESLEELYTKLTGLEAGNKTQAELKNAIAYVLANREDKQNAEKIVQALDDLSKVNENEAKEISGFMSDGSNLTRAAASKEIMAGEGGDIARYREELGDEVVNSWLQELGLASDEELANYLNERNSNVKKSFDLVEQSANRALGGNQIDEDGKLIQGSMLEQASKLMSDQTLQVYSDYLDQISLLYTRGGEEAVNAFQNSLSTLLEGATLGQQKQIKEIIGNTDLSNYDAAKNAIEEIRKILPEATDDLNNMDKALIELGRASKKVDLKSVMSNLTEALNLADDIENRDKSEGITQEELEKIVSSGVRDYSDFIFTGQEFVPVEDSMDSLAEAIRSNTDEVIKNTLALLKQSIGQGEYVEKQFENFDWTKVDKETRDRIVSGEADATLDWTDIRDILAMNAEASQEEVMSKYRSYMPDYLNLADNRAQEDAYKNYLTQSQAFQLDPQKQLDQGGAYLKERVEAEQLMGVQEKLAENLNKTSDAIEKDSDLMYAHTAQYAQSERKIKSLCEAIKNVKDAFDAGTEALKNGEKPSEDYYKALDKIADKGKDVFGQNADGEAYFDKEFVKQNAELVSQLSEGGKVGEQAFNQIQQAISQKALPDLLTFIDDTKYLNISLLDIENAKHQIELYGTADFSSLFANMDVASEDAQKLKKLLESFLGVTINFDAAYEWIPMQAFGFLTESQAREQGIEVKDGKVKKLKQIISAVGTRNDYSSSGFSSGSSGGSGGSSSSKEKVWENPYDKLYNLTEEINEALRRREALEREYDRILERRGSTFKEIRTNYNAQLSSLEHELKLQKQLQAGRKEQLDAIANERYTDSEGNRKTFAQTGATRYARYDQNLNRIIIDWDAIDMITDDDLGSAVEAYVSRLEELQDQFEEVDKTVEDMQDTVDELKKAQMQDYLDFEQSVYDALVNAQQKLIDEYQSLSDSIADSNSKILDNLQESIDLERQIRDNTKTEEDINEKEARLAFLRRDTSNANALEIKQLEEELSDARQDYSDSLIDQQLDRLSKQNDNAQEAREKQIELMQAQLDYASENGEFWNQAYELINDGFSSDGSLNQASQLWDLLKADQGWNGLSKFGQLNWQEEISKAIIAASQGYANWNMYKAEQVDKSLVLPDGTQLTYDGTNWKDNQGNVYKGVDFNSNKNQFEYGSIDYVKPAPTPETGGSGSSSEPEKKEISIGSSFNASGAPIYSYPGSSAQRQYFANDPYYVAIGEMGDYWMARWHGASSGVTGFFKKSDVRAYKTGGLADFTGPAWLDGSKTKPELVLNARDTENFLLLKDVLGGFIKNNTTTQNGKGGDNYYDIDISVDEIGSDYDVDQLARRIKEQITEDSTYRNVNAINFIR